jgi:hypothetical protein
LSHLPSTASLPSIAEGTVDGFGDEERERPPSPQSSLVSVESSLGIPSRRHDEELRCVIAVIRHADRTPKQKMKLSVTVRSPLHSSRLSSAYSFCSYFPLLSFLVFVSNESSSKLQEPKYLYYFHSFAKSPRKDLKVKSKSGLVKFLEVTRQVIEDNNFSGIHIHIPLFPRAKVKGSMT